MRKSKESKNKKKKKKIVLFPEVGRVEIFFTYPHTLVECVLEYIFFVSKKHTKKQKKVPIVNLFVQIYVFSLQRIQNRDVCFSAKKSSVRVVF